jgi:hypothetical protein
VGLQVGLHSLMWTCVDLWVLQMCYSRIEGHKFGNWWGPACILVEYSESLWINEEFLMCYVAIK